MGEVLLLVGLQWGDEGKGKVIDALAERFEVVIRFQGGANAGHSVQIGEEKFVLHLVPTGILHPGALSIIGNGVVVDPAALLEEIAGLKERGVKVAENLALSDRAHVVMPHHKLLDKAKESARGSNRLGTTGRGIGPCYADKAARCGIRFAEMMEPDLFRARLDALLDIYNPVLEKVYGLEALDRDAIYNEYRGYAEELRPYVRDTVPLVQEALEDGRGILLEGAQGSLLDIEFGTYPFVTSSDVIAGASAGTGIPPTRIDRVMGLAKAYCSRVGAGPFPTEQDNAVGETIRSTIEEHGGREYGATTGRARRCGWLDGVALRHTARLTGAGSLAVSVLDVLSAFETVKVCTAYRLNGQMLRAFPANAQALARVEPVYEELEGWQCDISEATSWGDLPGAARRYLRFVESLAGAPVEFVSVGPERTQVIERGPDE
ncbi:MAG: adenylosuccinate synthetase [Planctomycetes bacterium SM23_32]|nr:MAG: adenylosuccinate synthetase [Planctomycetes bacterium SM23_32]